MRNSFGFMFYLAGLSMLGYLATDMYLPPSAPCGKNCKFPPAR